MAFQVVGSNESWGQAGEFKLRTVDGGDGFACLFRAEGPWELMLIERRSEGRAESLCIPIAAPSKDAGERAGQCLTEAFAKVREILSEPAPDQETCEHTPVPMRFSRARGKVLICERCLKNFGAVDRERVA